MQRSRFLALVTVALLVVGACTGGNDQADAPGGAPEQGTEVKTDGGSADEADDDENEADKAEVTPLVEGERVSEPVAPPWWDKARTGQPNAVPTSPACNRTVRTNESIQDAIDAVVDKSAPYVLCLDGRFVGGGSPPNQARPGIGPYYGGIRIVGRDNFTLRGLPGSEIHGVLNDDQTPPEEAAAPEQHPNEKANLIKVQDGANIVLEGLTIDGLADGQPTLNRLVWLQNVRDSTVRFNVIRNAGGECVRLKSNSQRNEIHNNEITGCGVWQMSEQNKIERLRKNGEGVYIGTDPVQIATTQINKQIYYGLDPDLVTDRSSFNWVHNNRIAPGPDGSGYGNECVDMKEDWPEIQADLAGDDARGEPGNNWVTDNECSGQFDPESGAFDSRGPYNVFEHNRVFGDVVGAAIRVGAKEKEIGDDEVDWKAFDNRIRLNVLESYSTETAIKAWDDQPLADGDGTCANVDAKRRLIGDEVFVSDKDAGENLQRCSDSKLAPGPRGPVGVPNPR